MTEYRFRPVLLDLFCGAGGAAAGYHRAGFDVVGIDINPQPNFPTLPGFRFIQMDVMDLLKEPMHTLRQFGEWSAVHASPPCQAYTRARLVGTKKSNVPPDLIVQTRAILTALGLPYVIENVPRAPLINPITLCGSSFGLKVRRHRIFESNFPIDVTVCRHKEQGKPIGVYHRMGDQVQGRCSKTGNWVLGGRTASSIEEASAAMGISWMNWNEIKEAIPPAYTQHIGNSLMYHLGHDK